MEHFAHVKEGSGYSCGRVLEPTDEEEDGLEPLDIATALSDSDMREGGSRGDNGGGTKLRSTGDDTGEGLAADTEIAAGAAARLLSAEPVGAGNSSILAVDDKPGLELAGNSVDEGTRVRLSVEAGSSSILDEVPILGLEFDGNSADDVARVLFLSLKPDAGSSSIREVEGTRGLELGVVCAGNS